MTYVREQTSEELRAHMCRLQKMEGWHEPLADRLFEEVTAQDERIARFARLLAEMQGDELLSEQQCAKMFGVDLVSWRVIAHTFCRGSWGGPFDNSGPTTEQAIFRAGTR
jgi:hypothetical protein